MDRRVTFLVIGFFLIISAVSSEIVIDYYTLTYNYELFYEPSVTACNCEIAVSKILFRNTGNSPNSFTLTIENPLTQIYPSSFSLAPNEVIELSASITVPCQQNRDIDVSFGVEPLLGQMKIFTQKVLVNECNNLVAEPLKTQDSILACTPANFSLKIYNTGSFQETYMLSLVDFGGEAFLPEMLIIDPKKSKTVNIGLSPECGLYGEMKPLVEIKTMNTQLVTQIPILIDLIPNNNFSTYIDDSYFMCNKISDKIQMAIENRATIPNEYTISTDKEWAVLQTKNLSLEPNEEAQVDILVDLNNKDPGAYNFTLFVDSSLWDLRFEKTVIVDVENCYDSEIVISTKSICIDDDVLVFELMNKGKYTENFSLKLEAPDFLNLEYNKVELLSGQSAEIPIFIDNEKVSDGNYKILVSAEMPEMQASTEENVQILSVYECYKPQLDPNYLWLSHSTTAKELALNNIGMKNAHYSVNQYDVDWFELEDPEISVSPGSTELLMLNLNISEVKQGIYPVQFEITTNDDVSYREKVYFIIFDYTFSGFLARFKCFILLGVVALILLIFIYLLVFNKDNKEKSERYLKLSVFALLFMTIILIVCFNSLKNTLHVDYMEKINESQSECTSYYSQDICDSKLYYRWEEDTPYSINLSEFFHDPDGNILTYSYENNEFIEVEIEGDIVYLSPIKNWYGTTEMVFSAADSNGAAVTSPEFYLHVLDKKEFNLHDTLLTYHNYFFFCILVLLIILLLYLHIEYRQEKKEHNSSKKKKGKK